MLYEFKDTVKIAYNGLDIWGVVTVFSVLVLREVHENLRHLSKFSLLLENPYIKNSISLLYRLEQAQFVFNL